MPHDYAALVAQVIPVLLLAGVIEWPRMMDRAGVLVGGRSDRRSKARRARTANLSDAEVLAAYQESHARRTRWLRLRMYHLSTRWSVFVLWFSMLAAPVIMLLAEVVAVASVGEDTPPGTISWAIITAGFTLAISYVGMPLLVRAATDAAKAVGKVKALDREYVALLAERQELIDQYEALLAQRRTITEDESAGD